MLASAPLLPKFVSEGAAIYHELRKRGTRPRIRARLPTRRQRQPTRPRQTAKPGRGDGGTPIGGRQFPLVVDRGSAFAKLGSRRHDRRSGTVTTRSDRAR